MTDTLALDRASVRTIDQDGRLHVETSNISKANVCEYLGSEIPRASELGLDPRRLYKLLRDPAELAKAAPTFNNIPILSKHVPISADAPQQSLVIGSTGTDAAFEAPYLRNSLVFWTADAIADIEDEEKRELSCAYHYEVDLTPGSRDGESWDGVMRNLRGNHVALVEAGRAGPDVIVADEALPPNKQETTMAKPLSRKALLASGALTAYLRPKLAQDAKIDVRSLVAGVTAANWKAKRPGVITAITAATKGKLAADASLEDMHALMDSIDDVMDPDVMDEADKPVDKTDPEKTNAEDDEAETEEEKAARMAKRAADKAARDAESPEAKAEREKMEAAAAAKAKEATDNEPPPVTKKAMDAAIAANTTAVIKATVDRMNATREAEKFVRPWIGELAIAQDSAEAVLKLALDTLGIDTDGKHPDAYRDILAAQPKPGDVRPKHPIALDAKGAESFNSMFPGADRIRSI